MIFMESICFPCKLLIFHQKTEPAAKNPQTFGGWQFCLKMFVFSSFGPKIVQFSAEIFQNLVVWKQNNGFGRGIYFFVQKVKIFPGGKKKHVLTSWIDDLFVKTCCDMVRNARLIVGDCSVFPKFYMIFQKKFLSSDPLYSEGWDFSEVPRKFGCLNSHQFSELGFQIP